MRGKTMTVSTKKLCMYAMGVALFVILTLCLQVPVFENYTICLGYVVITIFCYYFGAGGGMIVGGTGVILYCLLTNGIRGMPGWVLGNLFIGLSVNLTCRFTVKMKQQALRHILIGVMIIISAAVAMLLVKSFVEVILYAQPLYVRMAKNMYAFVSDAAVMVLSLPICIALQQVFVKSFGDELIR